MPLYEYVCNECGVEFEKIRSFSDSSLPACPACLMENVRRKMGVPAIHFKGSGWYVTDSKSDNKQPTKSDDKSDNKDSDSSTDTKESTKQDSSKTEKSEKSEVKSVSETSSSETNKTRSSKSTNTGEKSE